MRPFSRLKTPLLAALLLLCAGCSRLAVEWAPGPREIAVVASGQKDATLVLMAGPPNGPHLVRKFPAVWSTVGPDLSGRPGGVEVARVAFDDAGAARLTIPTAALPREGILLQAVAFSAAEPWRPVAVSDCMSAVWRDGNVEIRSHLTEVLRSPIWWRVGAVVLLIVLCALLRRLPIAWGRMRPWPVILVFGCAVLLIVPRVRARDIPRSGGPDQAPPILPIARIAPEDPSDPLDRVIRPGFHELIINAGLKGASGEVINILQASDSGPSERDACQAAWLLWPHAVEIRKPGDDPFARRGTYLSFDAGPGKMGATIHFRNRAGCVWSVAAGEPK